MKRGLVLASRGPVHPELCRNPRWSELKPERVQLCQNSTLSTLAMSTKVDLWDVRFPIINDLDLYSGAVWDLLSATYRHIACAVGTLRCTRSRHVFHITCTFEC